jgi:hypothetical protein
LLLISLHDSLRLILLIIHCCLSEGALRLTWEFHVKLSTLAENPNDDAIVYPPPRAVAQSKQISNIRSTDEQTFRDI